MLKFTYNILLIDDDEEMNKKLTDILMGHRLKTEIAEVKFNVDAVEVATEKEREGFWKFDNETMQALEKCSRKKYDLILADFGLVDDEAKDILWGKDRKRNPTKEEAKGRLLTLLDLSQQFEKFIDGGSPNLFRKNYKVHLRSFASRLAFDLLGPVIPNRVRITRAAFPNAEVEAFDPRNEIYGNTEFYDFYEYQDIRGREFYRQIVGHHSVSVVDRYVLRELIDLAGKMRVRRSVFNLALFAGFVAIIGYATQYFEGLGLNLLAKKETIGWWMIFVGLLVLILGALSLAVYFESFSRKIIKWVGSERGFEHE